MAEIIKLKRARKALERDAKARAADANRARFGRSKVERDRLAHEAEVATRRLEGHLRDRPDPEE